MQLFKCLRRSSLILEESIILIHTWMYTLWFNVHAWVKLNIVVYWMVLYMNQFTNAQYVHLIITKVDTPYGSGTKVKVYCKSYVHETFWLMLVIMSITSYWYFDLCRSNTIVMLYLLLLLKCLRCFIFYVVPKNNSSNTLLMIYIHKFNLVGTKW